MASLELEYQTWEREECYGMFDYSETKLIKHHEKLILKGTGKLVKNIQNHSLSFINLDETVPQNSQSFLKIQCSRGNFFLNDDSQQDGEPLLSIPSETSGRGLREGDKIRMGKVKIQLLRLVWGAKNRSNHYEMIKEPTLAERQSIFASSFYSQKDKASFIQTNPSCKFCLSKTIEDKNPFMALCNCSGHSKYIHMDCLVEWVQKRKGISQDYPKGGFYCAQAKAFTCQVCKSIYRLDRLLNLVFGVLNNFQDYAVFYVELDIPLIYVIDLQQASEITIGRNLESLIIINELSVSRKHSKLVVNRAKKELIILDQRSKFGTGVEVKKKEINGSTQLQKGRTKITVVKHIKMSLLERLGFCSIQQHYGQQKKNQ